GNVNYYVLWYKNGILFDSTMTTSTSFVKGVGAEVIKAKLYPSSDESIGACYASSWSDNVTVADVTGVNTVNRAEQIVVSPNPFREELRIEGLQQGDKLSIYDMTGRQVSGVWSAGSGLQQLSTGSIAPGAYLLQITSADGTRKVMS